MNIKEIGDTPKGHYAMGAVYGKKYASNFINDTLDDKIQDKLNHYHNKSLNKRCDLYPQCGEKKFKEMGDEFSKGMEYGTRKAFKMTESELHELIKESINYILSENDEYIKYQKFGSPYDDTKEGNGQTQPLKDNVYLDRVRAMLNNVLIALNNEKIQDAKEQVLRIYKLVDAMINQS